MTTIEFTPYLTSLSTGIFSIAFPGDDKNEA